MTNAQPAPIQPPTSKIGEQYAAYVEAIPLIERERLAAEEHTRAEQEHADFRAAFAEDRCYICDKPLATFSVERPCLHALLKPKGFKKKQLPMIGERFGFFRMQAHLRWVANEEAPGKNINDLPEEGTGKHFECTIRYQHLDWSFSCGDTDFEGHASSEHARHPHYHFQMRIDGRPFINFNDFHLPLSKADVVHIEGMRARPDLIQATYPFGEGIRDVLESPDAIEHILSTPSTSRFEHEDNAALHIGSLIVADEGKTIRGEDVYALIQEAKEKGVSAASLLHKLPNTTAQVEVGPGPGVVRQATRSGRNKRANTE
jgi:hypothetical protein